MSTLSNAFVRSYRYVSVFFSEKGESSHKNRTKVCLMLNNRVSLLPPPLHNFLVIWSVTPLAWSYLQFTRLFGNQLKINTWLLLEYCPLSPSLSVFLPRVIPTKQSDLIYRIRLFFYFSSMFSARNELYRLLCRTGCSLNNVFFSRILKYFRTLAFLCFPSVSVYVHTPGR